MKKVALVTYATKYAGPGAVSALLAAGYIVVCHDESFHMEEKNYNFKKTFPQVVTIYEKNTGVLVNNVIEEFGQIDLFVSNDVYPLRYQMIDQIGMTDIREACESLLVWPLSLLAKVVQKMKEKRRGYILIITSAASARPKSGFSIYTALRACASVFAQTAACELAEYNITVNAIAPNFLESEDYYPPELWNMKNKKNELAQSVPKNRLGKSEEIGELITFLASGKVDFITGEIINFTGGWPLK